MTPAILTVFVLGYLAITFEHKLHVNKTATALVTGVACWALYILDVNTLLSTSMIPAWFRDQALADQVDHVARAFVLEQQLLQLTGETAGILLFLMGAMTIVELIDAHEGFAIVTTRIRATRKVSLFWVIGGLTFFVSSVLDNLTTTIVVISLLRKLIHDRNDRLLFAGMVVIAANAGGAWTVIGDVTTTMLWIKDKIGPTEVMRELFLGSLVSMLVPLACLSRFAQGRLQPVPEDPGEGQGGEKNIQPWHQALSLTLGLGGLLSVPVFKSLTHLPPYMGMMLSLGVVWAVTDLVGKTMDDHTKSSTGVLAALKRVDMSSVLFFLGILLAVGSLAAIGTLQAAAQWLDATLRSHEVVAILIGLISAIVDNVPLVAAGIDMYSLPRDDPFWMLLAYCAGTGGSGLIIGSAAGVAAMGLEQIDFLWYLRKITPWAVLGYFAGVATILIQRAVMG